MGHLENIKKGIIITYLSFLSFFVTSIWLLVLNCIHFETFILFLLTSVAYLLANSFKLFINLIAQIIVTACFLIIYYSKNTDIIDVEIRFSFIVIASCIYCLFFYKKLKKDLVQKSKKKTNLQRNIILISIAILLVWSTSSYIILDRRDIRNSKFTLIQIPDRQTNYHGTIYNYYSSGEIKSESNWKRGIPLGEIKYFYKNGNIKIKGNMLIDKNGKWEYWYENKQIMARGVWHKGERLGRWHYWYENGQLEKVESRHPGARVSDCMYWDVNGIEVSKEIYDFVNKINNHEVYIEQIINE